MSNDTLMAGFSAGAALQIAVPALIGLAAGAVGGAWAALQRAKAFKAEWIRDRQDARASTAVELIRTLSTELAQLSQEMWWLTWRARHDPGRLGIEQIDTWEHLTHELLPKTLGTLAALHAFSPESCHKIEDVTDALLKLTSDLGEAAIPVRNEPPEKEGRHARLAALHDETNGIIKQVRDDVGGAAEAVLRELGGSERAGLAFGKGSR